MTAPSPFGLPRPAPGRTGQEALPRPAGLPESGTAGWPTLGTTLTVAATCDEGLWAAPFSTVDAELLVCGSSMPTFGPGAPRTFGTVELPDPFARAQLGTDVVAMCARPFRLVWGRPGMTPASHVPAWLLLHDDGSATVVDVLRTDALTGGADLVPMVETAWLCREKGWRHELLTGTDAALDRETLIEVVLDAPEGLVSGPLWSAAFENLSLPALIDAIVSPGDLLAVRPYVLDCWAAAAARDAARARVSETPPMFPGR